MLFDRTVLERYSEFLDRQGLIVAGAEDDIGVKDNPRKKPGEDGRTHEQLVDDFLKHDLRSSDEFQVPSGWHVPDQQLEDLQRKLAGTEDMLRHEQQERVQAQRLLADRAHYVPRQELDGVQRRLEALDEQYRESLASHLNRDETEARDRGEIKRLKTKYVEELGAMREQLTRAYKILAGAFPPIPDADMARILYDQHPAPLDEDWDEGTWEQLTDAQKSVWRAYAERLRQEWSSTQHEPIPYQVLAEDWGQMNYEHTRVMTLLREKVPGLEVGPQGSVADAVEVLLDSISGIVQFGMGVIRSTWPAIQTMMRVMGYQWQDGEWRQVPAAEWEPAEPTQPAQDGVWAGMAERIKSGGVGAGQVLPADAVFSESTLGQAASEKLGKCQDALSRLSIGLEREGIMPQAGEDSVGVALRAIQNYWSPQLGLATTQTLLEELAARGNVGGWPSFATGAVQALLDGLDEDELTYKTASGRAAKDD